MGLHPKIVLSGSEIHTDGLKVYASLADNGYTLVQQIYDSKNRPEHLHWTHIIISNVKAFIDGTFHGLDSLHLQRYLDEFCYRLNRRWRSSNIVARLIDACINTGKITCHELIGQLFLSILSRERHRDYVSGIACHVSVNHGHFVVFAEVPYGTFFSLTDAGYSEDATRVKVSQLLGHERGEVTRIYLTSLIRHC